MSEQFLKLAVPGVRALRPYQPGKPLDELEREYGIRDAVKLASNENPLGPSPQALAALQAEVPEIARYPDGNGFVLKQALAARLAIDTGQITLGNGSNDVLELVARTFVAPDNEVIFSAHAFAVYPLVTQAVGAKAVVTPARDWGHDLAAMKAAITERTRLIFIANPNNPTGTYLRQAELAAFLRAVPEHVLVVLDEAYYEYSIHPATGASGYPDGLLWLAEQPNLIVTRTFSKAYGLAGLRIGYGVSHPEVADLLNRVRQPFNANSLALAAATAALDDTDHLEQSVRLNADGLQQYSDAFDAMGLRYIPSVGNFISVDTGRSVEDVYEALLRQGVIARPVANYALPGFLRISVGLAEENERAIAALHKVLED